MRKKINKMQDFLIRYRAGFKCCICRQNGIAHIHHIDGNPSNNDLENLVGLCEKCHSEAHTHHSLGRNLTADIIRKAKFQFEEEVKNRSFSSMIPVYDKYSQAMWTYFNFDKLQSTLQLYNINFVNNFYSKLIHNCVITAEGIPRFKNFKNCITIYDELDYDDSRILYAMYARAVNDLIPLISPKEFSVTRHKSILRNFINIGDFIFLNRGVTFYKAKDDRTRYVKTRYSKIVVDFFIDERFIYGTSCYVDTFVGTNSIFALLFVKSINTENGDLIFKTTPIAIGYGVNQSRAGSPYIEEIQKSNKSVFAYNNISASLDIANYGWEDSDIFG